MPEGDGGDDVNDTADSDGAGDPPRDEAVDPFEAAGVDPEPETDSEATFPVDDEKRAFLRAIADEIRERGDSSEAEQVAAIVYRVSDLYDPAEDTSPQEIYLNMRNIMNVKASGGIKR